MIADRRYEGKIRAVAFDAFPTLDARPVAALAHELYPEKGMDKVIFMKLQTGRHRITILAAWFFVPLVIFPESSQLELKRGFYAREPVECKDAPNAAILFWDGVGFSGAHSSKCTSRVLSRRGAELRVKTTCAALGDGKPDTSGYVDDFWLTRLSDSRFAIRKESRPKDTYRWCAANLK